MTQLADPYLSLLQAQTRPRSLLSAFQRAGSEPLGVTQVLDLLEAGPVPVTDVAVATDPEPAEAAWQLDLTLLDDKMAVPLRLWSQRVPDLDPEHLELERLSPDEIATARQADWSLGLATSLGDDPLGDYHRQLQLLARLVPDPALVLDHSASRPRPPSWLARVAGCPAPPGATELFYVHAVPDDSGPAPLAWLHSHGLLRCGLPEIELLEVPLDGAKLMATLLNTTATQWLDHGLPPTGEPFSVGAGLNLIWLPWEQALAHTSRDSEAAHPSRDSLHSEPSAVLFAPPASRLPVLRSMPRNPAHYLALLEGNPLLYVSHRETARMAAMARERFDRFRTLHEWLGPDGPYLFLIKLGYPTDHGADERDREHLWFRLEQLEDRDNGSVARATLLNDPFDVAALRQGEAADHDLALLTDWVVSGPHGQFGPSDIDRLEAILDDQSSC